MAGGRRPSVSGSACTRGSRRSARRATTASTSYVRPGSARSRAAVTCSCPRPRAHSSARALPDGVSVFPIGERHLKGIDEPERVFELDIEGVEAAPEEKPAKQRGPALGRARDGRARDQEFERRVEDFGQRLSDSIQDRVLRSLERTLGKVAPPTGSHDDHDDEAVDEMAGRCVRGPDPRPGRRSRPCIDAAAGTRLLAERIVPLGTFRPTRPLPSARCRTGSSCSRRRWEPGSCSRWSAGIALGRSLDALTRRLRRPRAPGPRGS